MASSPKQPAISSDVASALMGLLSQVQLVVTDPSYEEKAAILVRARDELKPFLPVVEPEQS